MKIRVLLLVSSVLVCRSLTAAADPVLQPHDRVAICGDSMTGEGRYESYLEECLLMAQRVDGLDFAQFGWVAQDPAAFLTKLDADVLPFKPTVALIQFNSGDVTTRAEAQTGLVEALKKAGARAIVLGSPRCVDSFLYHNDPSQAAAENKRLGTLAAIDRDVATKEGVIYADVYGATTAAMTKAKAQNGESYDFGGRDGYPTSDGCSLVMAYAYLKALGCDGPIGTITIDYAAGTAEGSPGQRVISFQDNTLKVESTRQPFHFPGYSSGRPDPDPILKCFPFNQKVNRYILVVKNLPSGQTKIYWGGDENRDYSSDDLAKGVNLTATMLNRVFAGQSENVGGAVRDQQYQEQRAGIARIQGNPDPRADAKREAALETARSRVGAVPETFRIQVLAQPEKQPPGPIPIILDTDLDGDVDDVGALALLNDFMDQGEVNLIACIHNTANSQLSSCATIQAVNAYYGHPSIPIGQSYGETGTAPHMTSVLLPPPPQGYHGPARLCGSSYTPQVHQRFDPNFPNDDKMPAGVDVYRKALASAADGKVVICSVGLMENLQDLIQSQPDAVSPLNGLDLVRRKVRELVVMANTVPQDAYILNKWPTKIIWSTDIGNYIYPGKSLVNTPENNPVRTAYHLFGADGGRQGWDLTAAWLAGRGTGDVYDLIAGAPQFISDLAHNSAGLRSKDFTATVKMGSSDVLALVNGELARPPKY